MVIDSSLLPSHYHYRKKILRRASVASKKNSPGRWWIPKPYRNQGSHIYHQNLSSVAPMFLGGEKFLTGTGRCMLSFSQQKGARQRGRVSERRHMQTNIDKRRGENANKRKQTRANPELLFLLLGIPCFFCKEFVPLIVLSLFSRDFRGLPGKFFFCGGFPYLFLRKHPVLLFLDVFVSLVFFFLGISLVVLSVFCLFYRVSEGSHGEINPWYF